MAAASTSSQIRESAASELTAITRFTWLLAVAAATVLVVTSIGFRVVMSQRLERAQITAASEQAKLHEVKLTIAGLRAHSSPAANFVEQLGTSLSIEPIVQELQSASGARGVLFTTVSAQTRDATDQTLGRANIKFTLNGNYPSLKFVLAEVMQRYPALILQQLTMRRLSGPTDLQAQVDVMLVARPLVTPVIAPPQASQAAHL